MGTKLLVGKQEIELPRGATIPRSGDIVVLTLKGEKKEKIYTVHLVEITFNLNSSIPIGNTVITLKELNDIEAD